MKQTRPSSPGLIIALISIPIFIGAVDLTVVSAVLPHVIFEFEVPLNTGLDEASWLVTGYLLAYSIAMTFMGVLLRAYYALGCGGRPAFSDAALNTLIAARMIQAFGAGGMVPVGMAVVGDLYPPGKRARMLGLIAAVDTAGWVVGHLYGGIITRYLSWRMIFWLNLPLCAAAFMLIAWLLHGLEHEPRSKEMDWCGVGLIAVSLALFNIAISAGGDASTSLSFDAGRQWPSYTAPSLLAALVSFGLFLWRQRHTQHPLIELHLFRRPNFAAAGLANFLLGFSLFIAIANVPLFINTLIATNLEQGAWDSGWMLSALTVPMALAAIPGGWLTDARGYRLSALIGLGLAIPGFLLMSTWDHGTPYGTMVPQLAAAGIGFGFAMTPITTAVIDTTPAEQRGMASGLVLILRLVGMTLGISSITTYDLQRSQSLSSRLLENGMDIAEINQVATRVAEQVIGETFLIAAGLCLMMLIPIMRLRALEMK